MKNKGFLIIFLSAFLILGISFYVSIQKKPFNGNFAKIPVHFFPFNNRAVIKVEVERKEYSVLIDLGSFHPFDFHKDSLEKIKNKQPAGISAYKNMKGDVFASQRFQIPVAKLLNWAVQDVVVCEESSDFISAAQIWPSSGLWNRIRDGLEPYLIQGRVGLDVFKKSCSLFDFPNSTIVIAKDISLLVNEAGCSLKDFTQVPFELEKLGVILSINTDLGTNRLLLDTGSTRSILKRSLVDKNKVKTTQSGNSFYTSNNFIIGGKDFDSRQFFLLEFSDSITCDGILGIDFFKKHSICLDFPNKIAYIKRHQTVYEKLKASLSL